MRGKCLSQKNVQKYVLVFNKHRILYYEIVAVVEEDPLFK